jgi:hypothetical protein
VEEGADKRGAIPLSYDLGIARLERKSWELRLMNSRDCELRQVTLGLALVIALWSLGEKVELMPSVVRTGELPEGPVDRFEEDSSRESKEPLRLREVNERSLRSWEQT